MFIGIGMGVGLGGGASDVVAPTVLITTPTNPNSVSAIHMTITFSEDVTGFVVGDITISAGGSLASFTPVSAAIYTVDWTLAAGANTMDIAAGVCVDGAGNSNTAAAQKKIWKLAPSADTILQAGNPTGTAGSSAQMLLRGVTTSTRVGLSKFDLTGVGSVSSVVLSTFAQALIPANATVTTRRILAANNLWTEAAATWNTQDGTNKWAGDAAGDGGTDAGCSVQGTDYSAAALGAFAVALNDVVGTQYNCVLDATEFAQMQAANHGILLYQPATDNINLCTKEHATAGYRPVLTLVEG